MRLNPRVTWLALPVTSPILRCFQKSPQEQKTPLSPHHLGKAKGFGSCEPGTVDEDQIHISYDKSKPPSMVGSLLEGSSDPASKVFTITWRGAGPGDLLLERGQSDGGSLQKSDYRNTATALWLSEGSPPCREAHDGGLVSELRSGSAPVGP